jgi:hypothetical protein
VSAEYGRTAGPAAPRRVDHLARFISHFLTKFRPSETVVIEYAAMCTSPRVGGFGGGVLTINKDGEVEEDE